MADDVCEGIENALNIIVLGNEGWMSCEVQLATLCWKNKGGSDEEMDAVCR